MTIEAERRERFRKEVAADKIERQEFYDEIREMDMRIHERAAEKTHSKPRTQIKPVPVQPAAPILPNPPPAPKYARSDTAHAAEKELRELHRTKERSVENASEQHDSILRGPVSHFAQDFLSFESDEYELKSTVLDLCNQYLVASGKSQITMTKLTQHLNRIGDGAISSYMESHKTQVDGKKIRRKTYQGLRLVCRNPAEGPVELLD